MEKDGKISNREKVVREIAEVINANSLEQDSNTPDFILAEYMIHCLEVYNSMTVIRAKWYGKEHRPGSCSY